jgi:predicted kinase
MALKGQGKSRSEADVTAFESYVGLAGRLVAPPQTFLILCHGFSGSGKSAASEALAQQIGAIRISSDIERKRTRQPLAAGNERCVERAAYTREAIDANYAHLRLLADELLHAGFPVIVDASFLLRGHRSSFIELAALRSVPVLVLHFEADFRTLAKRLSRRAMQAGEPSDADENVLRLQRIEAEPLTHGETDLVVTVNTDVPLDSFEEPALWLPLFDRLGISRGWLSGQASGARRNDGASA